MPEFMNLPEEVEGVELPSHKKLTREEFLALPIEIQQKHVTRKRQNDFINAFTAGAFETATKIWGEERSLIKDNDYVKRVKEKHPGMAMLGNVVGYMGNPVTIAGLIPAGRIITSQVLNKAGKALFLGIEGGIEAGLVEKDPNAVAIATILGSVFGTFAKAGRGVTEKTTKLLKAGKYAPKRLEGAIRLGGERAPTPRTAREDAKAVNEFFKSVIPDVKTKQLAEGTPRQLERGPIRLTGETPPKLERELAKEVNEARRKAHLRRTGKTESGGLQLPGQTRAPKEGQSVEGIYNQLIEVIDPQGRRIIVSPDGTTYIIK